MPWDWERLTDQQITMIFAAAIERVKKVEGKDVAPPADVRLPTEDQYVAQWKRFGGTDEELRAEYRRCLREDAKRADR
jgi:hypothetical protein